MENTQLQSFVPSLKEICLGAGEAIMNVYRSNNLGIKEKNDKSLVTLADLASHYYIAGHLRSSWPEIKLISEEDISSFDDFKNIQQFWLIDPLDGTKEFLQGSGEFTVNIALIVDSLPLLGMVYAPVLDLLYWGGAKLGSYRISKGHQHPIHVDLKSFYNQVRVEVSKSHLNQETIDLIKRLGTVELLKTASSLKFCRVAEGSADIYPRLAPTSQWDTAAAQAVLEGAGGVVVDVSGKPLRYGKSSILNPSFIAASSIEIIKPLLNPNFKKSNTPLL